MGEYLCILVSMHGDHVVTLCAAFLVETVLMDILLYLGLKCSWYIGKHTHLHV